jgi:hypothetical protein
MYLPGGQRGYIELPVSGSPSARVPIPTTHHVPTLPLPAGIFDGIYVVLTLVVGLPSSSKR